MKRAAEEFKFLNIPDTIQLNEYEDAGGCPMHVDAPTIGKEIGMFSFLSSVVMDFKYSILFIKSSFY
jgi:hypothetical protein